MKNGPTCKFNDWEVKYIQEPYNDRFFVISYKNSVSCKITSFCYFEDLQCLALPFELHSLIGSDAKNAKRWTMFLERIEKYNNYLDEL